MKHPRDAFPRNQHWFMLRTEQQLENFNQEPWVEVRPRTFLAGKIPLELDLATIRALCLEDVFAGQTDFTDIPGSLHLFPGLEYLSLPKKYVPQLQPGDIPESVRVLEIIGEGPATFPGVVSLPQIEQLAGLPTALKFTKYTFPRLRHLTLRLDRQRGMLSVIADMDQLETLGISPNRDGAVFEAVEKLKLVALYLGSGAIQTLDGIERLQSLRTVRLTNMDKLTNIEGLARLSNLTEITISWCANLVDYEALLEIPTLEYLEIFGCKKFDSRSYGPRLQSLSLKTLRHPR